MFTLLTVFLILSVLSFLIVIAVVIADGGPINHLIKNGFILWFYLELLVLTISIPLTFIILIFRYLES